MKKKTQQGEPMASTRGQTCGNFACKNPAGKGGGLLQKKKCMLFPFERLKGLASKDRELLESHRIFRLKKIRSGVSPG